MVCELRHLCTGEWIPDFQLVVADSFSIAGVGLRSAPHRWPLRGGVRCVLVGQVSLPATAQADAGSNPYRNSSVSICSCLASTFDRQHGLDRAFAGWTMARTNLSPAGLQFGFPTRFCTRPRAADSPWDASQDYAGCITGSRDIRWIALALGWARQEDRIKMILIIDNYDSFTWNIVQYLQELGQEVEVVRNDLLSVRQLMSMNADGIVLSPGPKSPNEAGVCLDLVAACADVGKPLLGICLGHQVIGQHFGGAVRRGGLMHGKVSQISHGGSGIFEGLPSPFSAVRYHSLVVGNVPRTLIVTAMSDDGFVMGLQHREHPIFGVQFHPESIGTNYGLEILANFLRYVG